MARRKRKANTFKLFRFGFLLILSVVVGVVSLTGAFANKTVFPGLSSEPVALSGLMVQGIDLSNLTRSESIAKLKELEPQLKQKTVQVVYQDTTHAVTLGALGISLDVNQTVNQIFSQINAMGTLERWRIKLHPVKEQWPAVLDIDRDVTKAELQKIADPLYVSAVNAGLNVNSQDQVVVKPAQDGYKVDIDTFMHELMKQLQQKDSLEKDITQSLEVAILEPELSTEEVSSWGVTTLLSRYTTQFNPALAGRTQNIKISAQALDGLMVAPGQVVSFNDVVGPRGVEQGYQNAGVIVGNKVEDGLGGGICQTVTTLYNSALLADLSVVQRGNHNIAISYAPIGLDAAVAYGSLDFKFKNNTQHHLLIKSSVQGNSITVKIYGHEQNKKNIQLKSWVDETIEPKVVYEVNPELEPGTSQVVQQGAPGYRVKAQRVITKDGREIRRDNLPSSHYLPVEKIIAVQSEEQIPKDPVPEEPSPTDTDAEKPTPDRSGQPDTENQQTAP